MSHLARAFHRAAVPLVAYYAVTLALPVANGAARSGTVFVKHAVVVLLVPLLAVSLCGTIHAVCAHLRLERLRVGEQPRPSLHVKEGARLNQRHLLDRGRDDQRHANSR